MSIGTRLLVFVLYWLPVPGLPRKLLKPRTRTLSPGITKYILVQSFGRNSLPDKKRRTQKELRAHLDAITGGRYTDPMLCFARLRDSGFDPGFVNRQLARATAQELRRWPRLIVPAQWEVAYALWHGSLVEDSLFESGQVICLWPLAAGYFGAAEVTSAALAALEDRDFAPDAGILLAHPDMIIRSLLICWRLGLDPAPLIEKLSFDRKSVQRWTRNPLFWFVRESLVRGHHLFHGLVSFTPPR